MLATALKSAVTVAALAALGLGGSAIADAANDPDSSRSAARQRHDLGQRETLSSEVAAKVEAAALEQVPDATVLRTESGGPYSTKYHAHIETADGTRKVVLVNASFEATTVQAERGRGGRGRGHGGAGETALTGTTKQQVEDAVLAEYSGATIERTETNGDGAAPYESHITTSAGEELKVLVSADFDVVDARRHP